MTIDEHSTLHVLFQSKLQLLHLWIPQKLAFYQSADHSIWEQRCTGRVKLGSLGLSRRGDQPVRTICPLLQTCSQRTWAQTMKGVLCLTGSPLQGARTSPARCKREVSLGTSPRHPSERHALATVGSVKRGEEMLKKMSGCAKGSQILVHRKLSTLFSILFQPHSSSFIFITCHHLSSPSCGVSPSQLRLASGG